MSGSDSASKGDDRDEEQNLKKVLSNNNAVLEHDKLNDHHALGCIREAVETHIVERVI
jgi:hypothetical protein